MSVLGFFYSQIPVDLSFFEFYIVSSVSTFDKYSLSSFLETSMLNKKSYTNITLNLWM